MPIDTDAIRSARPLSEIVGADVRLIGSSGEFRGLCPFHNDGRNPSFTVNDAKGFYHCFGCGAHGDAIDYVMESRRVDFKTACSVLSGGDVPSENNVGKRKRKPKPQPDPYADFEPIVPIPETVPIPAVGGACALVNPKRREEPKRFRSRFVPTMVFPYRAADGGLIGCVVRRELGDGRKETPFVMYCKMQDGGHDWTRMVPMDPTPLYRLDEVARSRGQVFICEGEKAADACARLLDVVATTWIGGANRIDKADFEPLRGKRVVLWPDHDGAGVRAMCGYWRNGRNGELNFISGAAQQALAAGASQVKLVDVQHDDTLPKGWDAADAESEGWSRVRLLSWLKAHVVELPADYRPQKDEPDETTTPQNAPAECPPPMQEPAQAQESDYGVSEQKPVRTTEFSTPYFRVLGHNHGRYYYITRGTQQVVDLVPSAHTKLNLLALAPLTWWESTFQSKRGVDWDAAANSLIIASHQAGIFDGTEMVRGRGAWIDDGHAVFHAGKTVYVDGRPYLPRDVPSEYVYEAAPKLGVSLDDPASTREAYRVVEIADMLTWANPLSASLLAGFCIVAPVCGILNWRPHIWVTGPAGSGKTTVIRDIVKRILGPIADLYANTTEAGIRQKLRSDARPVIIDEAEAEDERARRAMQDVLLLARRSSSGGALARGSRTGDVIEYIARSCFCFSSINPSIHHMADETRISRLVLQRNLMPDRDDHYEQLMENIQAWFTPEFSSRMIARSIANLEALRQNCDTFVSAAARVLGDRRAADQIGTLLAGKYLCHSTLRVTVEDAMAWIRRHDWAEHTAIDEMRDEERLLSRIASTRVRVVAERGIREFTLGELIIARGRRQYDIGIGIDIIERELGRYCIKVDGEKDGAYVIFGNRSDGLSDALRGTPWQENWAARLKDLGGEPVQVMYFSPGNKHRGIRLPLSVLEADAGGADVHSPPPEADELPATFV